ncbi:4Fe-4S binding protein [Methanogenium sp. MK-MG]|uniref:4Fe-4S binding protein n=1 Tax=Methanogenium sp. MK-MG TaxID=2599926 RepID=UPI0013ED3070|nr:4Fe-4S binding protein [Methanogenium sp. MK-MG]KAF1078491.1 Coenzyme F420-dependent sulfite reductase [Methanogenium sp. MK-MG]
MVQVMKHSYDPDSQSGVIVEDGMEAYTVRLRIPAGIVTPDQLRGIADAAQKYGGAGIHLTTRQTVEIPHVPEKNLQALGEELRKNGTPFGAEFQNVVNVTACPGNERCRLANIDAIPFALNIDRKYFGREMPVKTRIGISACPNSCVSERLCEVGVTGHLKPIRHPEKCTGCGACVDYCNEDALEVINGVIVLNDERCISCGACVHTCPYGVITAEDPVYEITFGGRRGRHPKIGRCLVLVNSLEAAELAVDEAMYRIYRQAVGTHLLADQLDEIGFDLIVKSVLAKLPEDSVVEHL